LDIDGFSTDSAEEASKTPAANMSLWRSNDLVNTVLLHCINAVHKRLHSRAAQL